MATLRGKKLSRYDLSYYDYHWFWGLRHNARVLPENMLTLHEQLMGNKKEWFYLKEQKITIGQQNRIILFFYQLFNIDDFALNTYKLDAIKTLYDYQLELDQAELFNGATGSAPQSSSNPMLASQYHFFYTASPSVLDNASNVLKSKTSELSQELKLLVDESIQPHLRTIGIDKKNGDQITLIELKHAYRKAALVGPYRHPDKGGNKEGFCKLSSALDSLDAFFFPDQHEGLSLNREWQDIFETLTRAEQSLTRTENSLEEIGKSNAEMKASVVDLNDTLQKLQAGVSDLMLRIAELERRNNEDDLEQAEEFSLEGEFETDSAALEGQDPLLSDFVLRQPSTLFYHTPLTPRHENKSPCDLGG